MSDKHRRQDARTSAAGGPEDEERAALGRCRLGEHDWSDWQVIGLWWADNDGERVTGGVDVMHYTRRVVERRVCWWCFEPDHLRHEQEKPILIEPSEATSPLLAAIASDRARFERGEVLLGTLNRCVCGVGLPPGWATCRSPSCPGPSGHEADPFDVGGLHHVGVEGATHCEHGRFWNQGCLACSREDLIAQRLLRASAAKRRDYAENGDPLM